MFVHCALGPHLIGASWVGRVLKTIARSSEVYVTGMLSVRLVLAIVHPMRPWRL